MTCSLKKIIILFILAIMLSACAGMNDSTRTKAEGTAIGPVIGGGLGYVIDRVLGDEKLGTAIGAVAQYNKELDEYNNKTVQKIASLDQEISDVKSRYTEDEAKLSALKDKQTEIAKYINESNILIAKKKKELAAFSEYQKTLQNIQNKQNVAVLEKEVETLKNNIAMLDKNNAQMAKLVESLNISK